VHQVTRAVSAATPIQARPAIARARAAIGSSVLSATQSAPCIASAAKAARPTSSVYQSRMPASGPGRKSTHSGSKNRPLSSNGTPRITLPSAAPKKIARRELEKANVTSQSGFHASLSMWFRNSMEQPRRMRSQSTIMRGR